MRGIHPRQVWSHNSIKTHKLETVAEVRRSKPMAARDFSELVELVAEVTYKNSDHCIFYRGQGHDHTNSTTSETSIYPSIFRSPSKKLSDEALNARFKLLKSKREMLIRKFSEEKLEGQDKVRKFPEIAWAVLQHYETCDTPLLDVTTSVRVAASFATNYGADKGVFYCLGFPNPTGGISYSVEEELLSIRLLSICPPSAKRPYFQEGFLVGSFPTFQERKGPHQDCAKRLIAKFSIGGSKFWSDDFRPIPETALKPAADKLLGFQEEDK